MYHKFNKFNAMQNNAQNTIQIDIQNGMQNDTQNEENTITFERPFTIASLLGVEEDIPFKFNDMHYIINKGDLFQLQSPTALAKVPANTFLDMMNCREFLIQHISNTLSELLCIPEMQLFVLAYGDCAQYPMFIRDNKLYWHRGEEESEASKETLQMVRKYKQYLRPYPMLTKYDAMRFRDQAIADRIRAVFKNT